MHLQFFGVLSAGDEVLCENELCVNSALSALLFAFPQSPSSKGKLFDETGKAVCSVWMLLVSDIYFNVLPQLLTLKMCRGLLSKLGFSFSSETFDSLKRVEIFRTAVIGIKTVLNVAKKKSIQIFVYQIDCIYEL